MCRFAGEEQLQRRKRRKYITMNFYNNIFCSAYKFYKESNSKVPRYASACIVSISQILLFLVALEIFKRLEIIDVIEIWKNKYTFAPVILSWILMVYSFYSREKLQRILERFELLSDRKKDAWGLISVFSIALPIIGVMILASK